MKVAGELTAVILAAGPGSRMRDITRNMPKCLLPVGNKAMVVHPLVKLIEAGFKETLLIVSKNEAQEIESKLSQLNLAIKINYLTINTSGEDHLGTVDSLRKISENINTDVLILSCDTFGDFNLVQFINKFRQNSPSLLTLACRGNVASVTRCYGSKNQLEKDIIGLDAKKRIVIFNSESDFEKNVTLTHNELNSSPGLTIHNNLLDGHVYLMKKSVLDIFLKQESVSSLKGELLPSLVQMQFSQDSTKSVERDLFEEECLKFEPASGPLRGLLLAEKSPPEWTNGCITCYLHLHPGYIIRANTLMGYIAANKKLVEKTILAQENARINRSSMIDASSTLGTNVNVVNSVIGSNCKVGNKVKIVDSVIMDGVTVEDGCCINNSVLCSNATIGKGSELDMCLVAHGFRVGEEVNAMNELLAEGSDLDIEDL